MTSHDLTPLILKGMRQNITESLVALKPFKTDLYPQWNLNSEIKAVIFDIYGTLLISGSGDIGISQEKHNFFPTHEILKKNGCELNFIDHDYRIKELLIQAIHNSHNKLREKGFDYPEVDIVSIWESVLNTLVEDDLIHCKPDLKTVSKIALDYELLVNPVWPMPGAKDILYHLKNRGLKQGIVSNAQFYTPLTLEALLDTSLQNLGFNDKYCYWSYAFRTAKPSSDLFLKLISDIQKDSEIKSDEILYIGNDMLNDVYAAKNAGLKTALFAGDKRSLRLRQNHKCCTDLKPDIILTELTQLMKLNQ